MNKSVYSRKIIHKKKILELRPVIQGEIQNSFDADAASSLLWTQKVHDTTGTALCTKGLIR